MDRWIHAFVLMSLAALSSAELLSQHMPALQSSVAYEGRAYLAVDGNTNQNFYAPACAHTNFDDQAWWVVNLREKKHVAEVKIYNRGDCCGERLANFDIKLGDHRDGPWKICNHFPGTASTGQVLALPCLGQGQYVRIQLRGTNFLTLCEVEVYGADQEATDHKEESDHHKYAPQITDSEVKIRPHKSLLPLAAIVGHHIAVPKHVDEEQLLSEGKPTLQSSTAHGGAQFAVDGNINQNNAAGSCTSTHHESRPWWQVDLVVEKEIRRVQIYNRGDCCGDKLANFKVKIAVHPGLWRTCNYVPGAAYTGQVLNLACPGAARFVRIQLRGTNTLTLCEVKVYGT